jgi:hypothetical protein
MPYNNGCGQERIRQSKNSSQSYRGRSRLSNLSAESYSIAESAVLPLAVTLRPSPSVVDLAYLNYKPQRMKNLTNGAALYCVQNQKLSFLLQLASQTDKNSIFRLDMSIDLPEVGGEADIVELRRFRKNKYAGL